MLCLTWWLSGCVSVPTSGGVERVEGQQQSCQSCVNVEVAPPSAGDAPEQVVEGFLRANANYQPNYAVARQFLTPTAAQKWSPEDGVAIYSGSPAATGDRVRLEGRLVGSLDRHRSYRVEDTKISRDFGLIRVNGQWRIGNPPAGLMVAEFAFTRFYSSYNLYFVGNQGRGSGPSTPGGVLVPDPIFLPYLRNQATIASALMKGLLDGPTDWLAPAVSSALPAGTTLSVDSVTITDGVASVPLSDAILTLTDTQRSLLAAQIVYTLKEALAVRGVLITVNQQPFRVPEGDPASSVVNVSAIPVDRNPVSPALSEQLYLVRDGGVQVLNDGSGEVRRVPGTLGAPRSGVGELAVSVGDTDLAAVVDGGTRLIRAPTANADAAAKTVLTGVTDLVRPQYTRFGELWAVGRRDGMSKVWRITSEGAREVSAPALAGRRITAFKISPDGTRMGVVEQTGRGSRLGLARINRADGVTVEDWRTVDTTQSAKPELARIRDIGWLDPTTVVVLGSSSDKDAFSPYQVSIDGSAIVDEGETIDWDPAAVTVLLRTQSALILSKDDQTWRDQGRTWVPLVDDCTAVAYPG